MSTARNTAKLEWRFQAILDGQPVEMYEPEQPESFEIKLLNAETGQVASYQEGIIGRAPLSGGQELVLSLREYDREEPSSYVAHSGIVPSA